MLDLQVFAERLKFARTKKNMSQAELAKTIGVATGTISVYENPNGGRCPAFDKTVAIAETLEVSIDWLCGRESKNAIELGGVVLLKELLEMVETLELMVEFPDATFNTVSLSVPSYQTTLIAFFKEYKKIEPILQDKNIDNYLKEGLKKALFEKFKERPFPEEYPF